jgi:hypothetical protein
MGHAIVVVKLGFERSSRRCTRGECRCGGDAEGKEREKEKPSHSARLL